MIEKEKRIYIGDGDILSLKHFVDGYCVCAMQHRIEYGEKRLTDFHQYVCKHFSEKRSISLFRCIKEHVKGKEEAFTVFFELMHKFLEAN